MAQALIQSILNGNQATKLTGLSRNDLSVGDKVYLRNVGDGYQSATHSWTLIYRPEGSNAALIGSIASSNPEYFLVDKEGSYLVRLVVNAGLAGEQTRFLRFRALTAFGGLHLIAAGERKNQTEAIPYDIDISGWTNDQNRNLLTILTFIKPLVSSGRVVFVDANDNTENYGDYSSVQEAIDFAVSQNPTAVAPYAVLVRAGTYNENLVLHPHIYLVGISGLSSRDGKKVVIQSLDATGFTTSLPDVGDASHILNIHLMGSFATSNPLLVKSGLGKLHIHQSTLTQLSGNISQGASLSITAGSVEITDSKIVQHDGGHDLNFAIVQSGLDSSLIAKRCYLIGPSCLQLNPDKHDVTRLTTKLLSCEVISTGGVNSYAVETYSNFQFDYCTVEVDSGKPISVNPNANALLSGDLVIQLRWCFVEGNVEWTITNTNGQNEIKIGSVQYGGLTEIGAISNPPYKVKVTGLISSSSLFYDNTTSGSTAENVQDAIDEAIVTSLNSVQDGFNLGGGEAVFKQKNATNVLEFKTLVGDPNINITAGVGELTFSFVPPNTTHNQIIQDNTSITITDDGNNAGSVVVNVDGTDFWTIDASGHLLPMVSGTQNIGSLTQRLKSIYVDHNLSIYFVKDDGVNPAFSQAHITSEELPSGGTALFLNGVMFASPEIRYFFARGSDIGWVSSGGMGVTFVDNLKYRTDGTQGHVGWPAEIDQNPQDAGTTFLNTTGQNIYLKSLRLTMYIGSNGGSVDNTNLTNILVNVRSMGVVSSHAVSPANPFDTLFDYDFVLDIPNVAPTSNIEVEISFIQGVQTIIPITLYGARLGYILQ